MMTTNRLTPEQRRTAEVARLPLFVSGHGYGMGTAVVMEPDHAEPLVCGGSKGAVGWPGAYGGWWRADPADSSVRIFLAHNMVTRQQFADGVGFGVYEAITAFHEAA
jgi:CubicO group peptidase (beta-lactamase class C family)